MQLHFYGSVFELADDQSVADVFNVLNSYTREQQGLTWLKMADGRTAHFQVDGQPTYAVVAPKGYLPEGLKATRRYPGTSPVQEEGDEPFDPSSV